MEVNNMNKELKLHVDTYLSAHHCPGCHTKMNESSYTERNGCGIFIVWEVLTCQDECCGFKFKKIVAVTP